jgi:glycosyltransferase involved in cell wall biosynthesis
LQALNAQTVGADQYEVVIVDDGSTDGTTEQIAALIDKSVLNVSFFRQDHKGPAAARNLGIREACGELVLFIGDDIIATPTLLGEHLAWHDKYPEKNVAVLGYVTWSPEIEITPFMRWLENGGPQFKYWSINDSENVSWRHLYTANISFKRRFLLDNGLFDEDFPYASYEDTELGYRLQQRGLCIVYKKQAVGYHYHLTSLDDAMRRMQRVAESRRIFFEKTRKGSVENRDCRGWVHRILSEVKFWLFWQMGRIAERRRIMHGVYSYLLDKAQFKIGEG